MMIMIIIIIIVIIIIQSVLISHASTKIYNVVIFTLHDNLCQNFVKKQAANHYESNQGTNSHYMPS